ncbi:hypothetical protein JCM5296_002336 [Sporobolomyces johnsonii]
MASQPPESTYVSFDAPPGFLDGNDDGPSALSRLKRFFASGTSTNQPGASSQSTQSHDTSSISTDAPGSREREPSSAGKLPSAKQHLASVAEAADAAKGARRSSRDRRTTPPAQDQCAEPTVSHVTLPSGQKYTRRLRLSGVSPSVGVTVQNSERGALIQSATSRSLASDYRYGTGGGGGIHGSPTTSDAYGGLTFANLSSIPGFPLRGDGDDSKSVWSVSTVARPSPSVVQVFRRLQGEGISKDYWIKDESSKACFSCQTVFTVFRRKHHCRLCGQIFCAKCAANLVSAAPFGQQGNLRICNICYGMAQQERVNPAEEPQSRLRSSLRESAYPASSIIDHSRPSRPSSLYQSVTRPVWNNPSESILQEVDDGQMSGPPSRPRSPTSDGGEDDDPEARRSPMSSLRMQQRQQQIQGDAELPHSPSLSTATAPFRRELAEEDQAEQEPEAKDGLGISMQVNGLGLTLDDGIPEQEGASSSQMGIPPPSLAVSRTTSPSFNPPLPHPSIEHALQSSLSAISNRPDSFKRSSRPVSPAMLAAQDLRQSPSLRYFDRSTSRLSLSLPDHASAHFRDLSLEVFDPFELQKDAFLSADEAPPEIPLSQSSLDHIRRMIRQGLEREEVPNAKAWESVLERLLLQVADGPVPNLHAGDAIDVRRYVRVKKLPGGRPRHSEFIDGVLFTKNLLHKKMARELSNPRIAVFSFPLDFPRPDQHLQQLERLQEQEPDWLRGLVSRIVALRPHLVLVERHVSRLALDLLLEREVAVAHNIKPEAISAIARATQATVIGSMDQLALQPSLGRCRKFRVQTFVHPLIPGQRKSFLRFEGCPRDLGCTLLLRGGSMEVLAKVKKIVNLLVPVVYNAKLEGYLFYDERLDFIPMPEAPPPDLEGDEDKDERMTIEERRTRQISKTLQPYRSTALSASSLVRFAPPYALAKMADEDRRLRELREARDAAETQKIIEEEAASRAQSISAGSSSASLSSLNGGQPSISRVLLDAASAALDPTKKFLQVPDEVAKIHEVAEAEERHAERLVAWETYREQNQDSLDPADHQRLFVLESLLCGKPEDPKKVCRPPVINSITFYGDDDLTISQYIAQTVRSFHEACPAPSCHQPLGYHQRVYVHGDYRIRISGERWQPTAPEELSLRGTIGLRTTCERCGCRGSLARMSDETCRLSFHKFLELSFYPSEHLVCQKENCPHDVYLDHTRYWYFGGVRIAISTERIDLRDVVPPPRIVKVKPDAQLQIRNVEYQTVEQRSKAFFDSVMARIVAFRLDCVQLERHEECQAALVDFTSRCEADRRAIGRLLVSAYEHAQDTNGTEMTVVRRALQEKVVAFETEWTAFEKRVILSEQDSRRPSKRLSPDSHRSMSPGRRSTSASLAPSIEVEEGDSEASGVSVTPTSTSSSVESFEDTTDGDSASSIGHPADSSTDSTATIATPSDLASLSPLDLAPQLLHPGLTPPVAISPLALSPAPHSPTALPFAPLAPAVKISNLPLSVSTATSDIDSDSTVCADSRRPSFNRPSSPFIRKVQLPTEETSAAESEPEEQPARRRRPGQHVSELLDVFESASVGRSDSLRAKTGSPARPSIRRGHSEKTRQSKIRPPGPLALSDGDSSYARNVGVFHLLDSPAAAKPSRIPARKVYKPNTLAEVFAPLESTGTAAPDPSPSTRCKASTSPSSSRPGSRASSRPASRPLSPASSRPQSPTQTRSALSRPPLKSASSSRSTIKGKAPREQSSRVPESHDAGRLPKTKASRTLGVARPTTSSTNKVTTRRVVSSGTSKVGHMVRRFDSLGAANEKRNAMRKRARPIITSQPTVQIFTNVRDAAKEDSDDEDERRSNNESDGADDEFDNEQEGPDRDEDGSDTEERRARSRKPSVSAGKAVALPVVQHELSPSPSTPHPSSMADALARSAQPTPHVTAEPRQPSPSRIPQDLDLLGIRPESTMYDFSHYTPSDSDFPSVPPSPYLRGAQTLPRMSEGDSSGAERSSLFKGLLSGLFYFRNGDFSQLEYPMLPTEHLFSDNPILLRDDEPSSIIAYALSSKIYYQSVEATKLPAPGSGRPAGEGTISKEEGGEYAAKQPTIEDFLRRPDEASLRIATDDASLSASCKIFFAEHFEALRRQCGCEKQFIESLSRCYKWDSAGGKSKADFMKTLDDRFIVKQLSSWEVDVLSSFLPAYFQYMADVLFRGQPTVLAKIFGIYRISFGKKYKNLDFLVMENLFYGRQLKQIFDLKGSTRNRRADQSNPVLLDENLMEMSLKQPFYVREESKLFIKQAIYNDSQFLSDLNVMDYSLVVGVDSSKQELVVGIVDFIRTYTWNKRIESWVKETTFIGGASKSGGPTIITPKQYKMRFREAIDGYLLLSPTPWLSSTSLLALTDGQRTCGPQDGKETAAAAGPAPASDTKASS